MKQIAAPTCTDPRSQSRQRYVSQRNKHNRRPVSSLYLSALCSLKLQCYNGPQTVTVTSMVSARTPRRPRTATACGLHFRGSKSRLQRLVNGTDLRHHFIVVMKPNILWPLPWWPKILQGSLTKGHDWGVKTPQNSNTRCGRYFVSNRSAPTDENAVKCWHGISNTATAEFLILRKQEQEGGAEKSFTNMYEIY